MIALLLYHLSCELFPSSKLSHLLLIYGLEISSFVYLSIIIIFWFGVLVVFGWNFIWSLFSLLSWYSRFVAMFIYSPWLCQSYPWLLCSPLVFPLFVFCSFSSSYFLRFLGTFIFDLVNLLIRVHDPFDFNCVASFSYILLPYFSHNADCIFWSIMPVLLPAAV